MLLRSPWSKLAVFGSVFCISVVPAIAAQDGPGMMVQSPQASANSSPMVTARWSVLNQDQRKMVDLLAADFFNRSLTASQRGVIAGATADAYAKATPQEQRVFRQQRRAAWQKLTPVDKALDQAMPRPTYRSLTDSQKRPFRDIAIQELGLKVPARRKYGQAV